MYHFGKFENAWLFSTLKFYARNFELAELPTNFHLWRGLLIFFFAKSPCAKNRKVYNEIESVIVL